MAKSSLKKTSRISIIAKGKLMNVLNSIVFLLLGKDTSNERPSKMATRFRLNFLERIPRPIGECIKSQHWPLTGKSLMASSSSPRENKSCD